MTECECQNINGRMVPDYWRTWCFALALAVFVLWGCVSKASEDVRRVSRRCAEIEERYAEIESGHAERSQ